MNQNNNFHIHKPYFSAWRRYGWSKNDWGLGLRKEIIDKLAEQNLIAIISYGQSNQKYTLAARKIQQYPIESIKNSNILVYIIPKSSLNYKKSYKEEMQYLCQLGIFG